MIRRLQPDVSLYGKFQGVGKQVVHNLLQMPSVTTDNRIHTGETGQHPQPLLFDQWRVVVRNLPEQGFQTEDGDVLPELSGIQQVEVHQRVHQREHIV